MSPFVLGIETATALGGVAVVSDTGLLGEITLLNAESHSERILPAAEHLLATLRIRPCDLSAVAVSSGPGSFTGLRTGIASAKGLAFALGIPLFGVPTLEALAANAPFCDLPIGAVLNARRGEVFFALFRHGASGLERLGEETVVAHSRLGEMLPRDCLVLGDPPALLQGLDAARGWRFAPRHLGHPRAAVIAARGLQLLCADRPSAVDDLLPRYLRAPDAEVLARRARDESCRAAGAGRCAAS